MQCLLSRTVEVYRSESVSLMHGAYSIRAGVRDHYRSEANVAEPLRRGCHRKVPVVSDQWDGGLRGIACATVLPHLLTSPAAALTFPDIA